MKENQEGTIVQGYDEPIKLLELGPEDVSGTHYLPLISLGASIIKPLWPVLRTAFREALKGKAPSVASMGSPDPRLRLV